MSSDTEQQQNQLHKIEQNERKRLLAFSKSKMVISKKSAAV